MATARAQLTSLPNLLTLGRIVAIPFVVLLVVWGDPIGRAAALILYALAAFTDWLDGYLARRSGLVSPIGKMLDPIADKMLVGAVLVTFAFDGSFNATDLVPALAILLREIFVAGLREFMGDEKIAVTRLAKWKTTVQMVALGGVFLAPLLPTVWPVVRLLLWLAGLLTVITGAQYLRGAWPRLVGEP